MGYVFLMLLNRSITAGWLVLAVLAVRFLFRRMPKWICCLLWAIVAIRLLLPISIESAFSLQPSAEPISVTSGIETSTLSSQLADGDAVFVEKPTAYEMTESMTPLQIVVGIAGFVWLCGMILLLAVAVVITLRLHRLVREGVCYQEKVCVDLSSGFC